jgi:DMSO/TMAO reductase YedYZ molybdopterin-dependent catalytic subunit
MGGTPVGRRVFLGMLGLGAVGVLVGARVQDVMERVLGPITVKDGTGISALLPTGRFRIYSVVGFLPRHRREEYQLAIGGLVDRPLTLTYADLRARPATRLVKDFQCVTGWRVHDVPWTGVSLATLLDEAGVHADARAVTFHSFDGLYTESLTLAQARRPDVLVAYKMDDKLLSAAHGGPVRLYVAPMYGYKSCKWLSAIEVVGKVQPGYWERRGYDVNAWIGRSNGRSDDRV